jgi:cytochrome c oxidase cbb3-type subunit 2
VNRDLSLAARLLGIVAVSWFGAVLVPSWQLGGLNMTTLEDTGQSYPLALPGEAQHGQAVFRAHGCYYCHTQQVRQDEPGAGSDRQWGKRRTVARDYLRAQPVMLGNLRLGPDLTNLGARETNAHRLLLRLYRPQALSPLSFMPSYRFLFDKDSSPAASAGVAADSGPLVSNWWAAAGVQPKPEALALVAYLQSLQAEALFYEVFPAPPPRRTGPAGSESLMTNLPAAIAPSTNAPSAK